MDNAENISNIYTTEEITLHVTGWAWGGFEGEMEYTITAEQAENLKELHDVERIAGDFDGVKTANIVRCKVTREYTIQTIGDDEEE